MNIFVATNNTYFRQLMVFMSSIAKHKSEDINLTVLYSDLESKNISKVNSFAKKVGLTIRFYLVNDNRSSQYNLIHQITKETYYRFLLLDIYPCEERALWMDIDTVVLKDLSYFYHTDFGDTYIIGTQGNNSEKHLERLGLNKNGTYINAGVILFNLKLIRDNFSKDFLYTCYEQNASKIRFSDQDVINIAFADRIRNMPDRRYNYIIMSGEETGKERLKFIKQNCAIVHYIRHIKPWQHYYQGSIRYIYLREMFRIYPFRSIFLMVAGELYKFKKNKKTLENSVK